LNQKYVIFNKTIYIELFLFLGGDETLLCVYQPTVYPQMDRMICVLWERETYNKDID